jgi:PAS domain S-box-containing protein
MWSRARLAFWDRPTNDTGRARPSDRPGLRDARPGNARSIAVKPSPTESRIQAILATALVLCAVLCAASGLAIEAASRGAAGTWTPFARGVLAVGGLLTCALIVLAIVAVRRDVVGRRRAEAELERFFSLSLDFLCISSGDGYFKRVSPAVTDILGWTPAEFLARPYLDFIHPDDHAATLAEVDRQLRSGERVLSFENRYRHKCGSWRVLSWRSMPQPDGMMYATARDVTLLKEAERARLDESLEFGERRFRALVERGSDSIALIDAQNRILYLSPNVATVEGYAPEELLGRSGIEHTHPDDLPRVAAIVEQLVAQPGTPIPVMWRRRHKDGRWLWLEGVATNLLADPAVGAIVTNYRDVTSRMQAETELRASQERFQFVARATNDVVWDWDLAQDTIWWNDKFAELFGYRAAEIESSSTSWTGRIHPDDVDRVVSGIHAVIDGTGQSWSDEYRFRRGDGSYAEILDRGFVIRDASGAALRMVGAMQDITERKHAEAKLRTQLARLALLSHITRAIGERRDERSIFLVVARTLEEELPVDFCCVSLYDRARSELTVSGVGPAGAALATGLGMQGGSRIEIDENGLSRCVRGQLVYEPDVAGVTFPFPRRLAGGGLRSVVFAPLLVEKEVFGILMVARRAAHAFSSADCEFLQQLSEHVALAAHQSQLHAALQKAYDDLHRSQQVVMQQERLRAVGQMASGIAHDINNAISPITLYAESLLEREPGLSGRARDQLETIQRAIGDVAQTVSRMREVYRPREPQLTLAPVDLNAVARQVLDLTRARWSDMAHRHGVAIEIRAEPTEGLPQILGAESEIRDALTNLVLNAADAMPNGGVLTLRTVHRAGRVCLEVGDTGVGMDEDARRRCLEPFFTTKGERGTGLGLAMVYGAVQRHSGELDIDSAPGRGTTVRLSFAAPGADRIATVRETQAVPVPAAQRILVVDDDPVLLKTLRDILEADGHGVTVTHGGQAGIDAFHAAQEKGEPPDVVITDLGMPNVDGRKVASAVKALSPKTPVVMLTGWGQRLIADGDVPLHVDRVLSKPPKLRELREALSEVARGPDPA